MRRGCLLAVLALILSGCASLQAHKETFSRTAMLDLRQGIELFHIQNGRYPTEAEGLAVLAPPAGNYVTAIPADPWGRPYRYRLRDGRAVIDSAGPDGAFGTADDVSVGD